jgi:hypothetical protein
MEAGGMIDSKMQALIDAPLADPAKIYLPEDRRPAKRGPRTQCDDIGAPKLTGKQIAERKRKAASAKLATLFDYYAPTGLSAARVAEYMGLYRQQQDGTNDKGKPIFIRVLDVETVEAQLAWPRAKAA